MDQKEMSNFLKIITVGVSVVLLILVVWFLPSVLKELLMETAGVNGYRVVCILIGVSAVPSFLCLWKFWGICGRIGRDQSFTEENAAALKTMSRYMLAETVFYVGMVCAFCMIGWHIAAPWLLFLLFLIIFISITMTVICAVLSHLVHKASDLQKEQDLTI